MLVFHGKMTNQPSYSGTCHRPSRPSCVESLSNRSPRPWKRVNYGESSMPCRGRMTRGKKENEIRIRINQRKELETVATLIAMIRQDGSRGQKRRRREDRRESLAQLHVGSQMASFSSRLPRNRCRTESRDQIRSKVKLNIVRIRGRNRPPETVPGSGRSPPTRSMSPRSPQPAVGQHVMTWT